MDLSYLAAPTRHHLSSTAKTLLKLNLLTFTDTHLDYGCGKGGDVEKLLNLGYQSTGYDPYYYPIKLEMSYDIVSMSYVLNVIQDEEQRKEALINAFKLTKNLLIVSTNSNRSGGAPAAHHPAVVVTI